MVQDYKFLTLWHCPTPLEKGSFYGKYPDTFLEQALSLFPQAYDILHAPSGCLGEHRRMPDGHVTLDLVFDEHRKPGSVVATNTSGLSIRSMCDGRSESWNKRWVATRPS